MLTITIVGWEQMQPRRDRKNHTWFRVNNTIIYSESLDGLGADQKWFWICLLSYASKKQSSILEYNSTYFEKHFGLCNSKMMEALEHLHQRGAVMLQHDFVALPPDTITLDDETITSQVGAVTSQVGAVTSQVGAVTSHDGVTWTPNASLQTNKQTYIQPQAPRGCAPELHKLWPKYLELVSQYPIKVYATKRGFERFQKAAKDETGADKILTHLANYKKNLEKNEWKIPKQTIETFIGTDKSGFFWEQWETSEVGDFKEEKKKTNYSGLKGVVDKI